MYGGSIYTSTDSGTKWTEQTAAEGDINSKSVASSADGTKLVAVLESTDGYIYTSTDSGVTWAKRTAAKGYYTYWTDISGIVAGRDKARGGGRLYVSRSIQCRQDLHVDGLPP